MKSGEKIKKTLLFLISIPLLIFRYSDFYLSCFNKKDKEILINKNSDYCILVMGGGVLEGKFLGFDKIHKSAYLGLRKRGFSDNQIITLSTTKIRKSGINLKPTKENFEKVFLEMTLLKKEKNIVFHFIGHGHLSKNQSTLVLGANEIKQKNFFKIAKKIEAKKFFCFDQCYSGGFFEEAKKLKNIVVLASTKKKYIALPKNIEVFFWKEIGKGKDFKKSYEEIAKTNGKKDFLDKILTKLSFGKTASFYLTYKDSNIKLPVPNG